MTTSSKRVFHFIDLTESQEIINPSTSQSPAAKKPKLERQARVDHQRPQQEFMSTTDRVVHHSVDLDSYEPSEILILDGYIIKWDECHIAPTNCSVVDFHNDFDGGDQLIANIIISSEPWVFAQWLAHCYDDGH